MKASLDRLGLDAAAALPPERQAERLQVLALVEQFEGMLLTEMLRDVDAGDGEDEDAFGLGGSTMTDMMKGEFGLALSRAGGLGLRELLAGALLGGPAADGAGPAGLPPADFVPAVVPGRTPVAAPPDAGQSGSGRATDIVAASTPVSSAYGWRSDPFTGQARFHRGVDLALAYGSDVRAFGPGVVSSAGERPGYGMTVVVDHGGGRETLYAHLSAIDVAPGQRVEAGQRIARSGNSGRATGAHLHFEAREFGQAVDAEALAATWAGRSVDRGVGPSDEIPSEG